MSEVNTLELALVELINKSMEGVDKAADFMAAELPIVIEQALLWHMTHSMVMFFVGIIMMAVSAYSAKRFASIAFAPRFNNDGELNDYFEKIGGTVYFKNEYLYLMPVYATASLLAIAISLTVTNITWLKIWLAPKLWLIEYAATLAK